MDDQRHESKYEGLYGTDFVERARENRDIPALEAIWRVRQSPAAQLVIESLASLRVPNLSDLLLEEALEAELGPEVAAAIQAAIRRHFPPLSPGGSGRLMGWLRDNELAEGGYTSAREVLEIWLLSQEAAEADSFAIDLLTDELAYDVSKECRQAALKRCFDYPRLAERVAIKLEAALSEDPSSEAWELAATFVEAMTRGRNPPTYLGPPTDRLIVSATEFCPVEEFSENLRRTMIRLSSPAVKKLLSADRLPDSLGSRALVRLHGYFRRPQERAKIFIDILDTQSAVWGIVGQAMMESWDSTEWERRFAAVKKSDRSFDKNLLVALIEAAPPEHASLILQIAVHRADEPEEPLVTATGAKLGQFISGTEETQDEPSTEDRLKSIPWWPSEAPPARLRIFDAALREAIPEVDDRVPHIVAGLQDGRISPDSALHLIDPDEFGQVLARMAPGELRRDMTAKLMQKDGEGAVEAVRAISTNEGFQIDLAESVATSSPETAFLGAGDAYPELSDSDRARLVNLLEKYCRSEEVPILDVIVQDTRAANVENRRLAAIRIGDITPEGGSPPASVVELLRSNRPELVDTGAAVIGRVKPEEPTLIRLLRSVAIDSDEESEARMALSSLAETFVNRLSPELAKEHRVHLLNLLAAAATPDVVDPLLSHVGRDALDDDPEVRRLAAAGLKEVASQSSLHPNQLARLTMVIEEERDPTAREDLQAAVTRATLGEDAALEVLHEILAFSPKNDLRDLLASEKERVVRHLQLLATERERGEQGRPGVIMQLDIIAERILRVAYLRHGQSDSLKHEIQTSAKTPDHGQLIQALSSVKKLQRIQGRLQTLHSLRSEKTEFTHTGDAPTDEDEVTSWTCFTEAVRVMVRVLDQD